VVTAVPQPLVLIIMDGWGEGKGREGNAVALARTPNIDLYKEKYPYTLLGAAGEEVGLPEGQMGNSEVGHLNLGAGRIVYQDFTRISRAIREGEFYRNPVLVDVMQQAQGHSLHLIGLLSDGGVHSHIQHLYALLELAAAQGLERVYVHAFLDGRDVPPTCAARYFVELERKFEALGCGSVATVSGRYWAMDRDKRWERTALAYKALVAGQGETAMSAQEAVQKAYERGESDEFVRPTVILAGNGAPRGRVQEGDAVIFFNFRPDRARQLTRAFVDADFSGFDRGPTPPKVHFVCLTQYDETIAAPVAFPPQSLANTLGEYLSRQGLRQLRIAETEKYAHVTFFFNGGEEKPFPGEERRLIPSPKVATYDLKPEMSAYEVTDALLTELKENKYDLVVLNYANADMVGHTGNLQAAVRAVEAVDDCVGRVVPEVLALGGAIIVTADHGNAEEMINPTTGEPQTAHSTNPVPFILITAEPRENHLATGRLADVAPTILELLRLPQPEVMSGRSLLKGRDNEKGG
jgi:2,3-bisphosphoglycerate-independent phosphoglycerate mutase